MRALSLALGFVLAVALAPVSSARAGRVDVPLRTGTSASGVVERPGAVSTAAFLVLDGAKRNLSITVKRAKKSDLLPQIVVIDPDGAIVDLVALGGKVKAKSTSFKAKLKDVPTAGLWRVEVRGADGTTGAYAISVKSKDNTVTKGSTVVALGRAALVPIPAGDGYSLTISAKRSRGSSLVPDIEVIDPNGNVLASSIGAAAVNAKKGTAKLKNLELPTYGDYVIRFVGDEGTGGGVAYSIKTKPSKFKGDRPIAVTGDATAAEPEIEATLDATASVPSAPGRSLQTIWTQVGGPAVTLSDPGSTRATFMAPQIDARARPTSLAFQLAVVENGVVSEPRVVVIEVAQRPIADPGRARSVIPGASVTLDAGGSFDRNGAGLTHAWRVIEGGVTLDDPSSATPSFTAPASDAVIRLGLVVDDGRARSFESTLVVAVANSPGDVADAGREQYVGRMASVHLSGLASQGVSTLLDGDGAPSGTVTWTQLSGPPVDLDGAQTLYAAFTAPRQAADLMFELRVNDVAATAHTTWVRVRPDESNLPPTTIANGPLLATAGSVTLNASSSFDVDGDPVTTRWAAVSGAGSTVADVRAAISSADGLSDPAGRWIFATQARDHLQYGAPEIVRVIAAEYVGAPLANAGSNRSVASTTAVGLDGSRSFSPSTGDADDLTFAWRQVSGSDWYNVVTESSEFDGSSERPTFRFPADLSSLTATRSLTFELVVSDSNGTSAPDLVTLVFTGLPLNSKPVVSAVASEKDPLPGTVVTLTGTAFDRDGDNVTTTWTQVSGPGVTLTPDRNVLSPAFAAPSAGTLVFDLVGNDGFEDGVAARVTVTVDAKPVAIATATPPDGPATTIVTFDASESSDPEAAELSYTWTQISGTAVSFVPTAVSFQVQSPLNGMTFRLVVNDGRQDSDPVQIAFSDETPPTVAPSSDKSAAAYGATVRLRANPSDTDPATFTWRQINAAGTDPSVTLSSKSTQNPTFTAPLPTTSAFGASPAATFGVIASREGRSSEEQTVRVTFFASYNDTSLSSSNRVYGIISQSCTSCHRGSATFCPVGSGGTATGFGMGNANAFASNGIGVNSCNSSKSRVRASNSGQSFLIDRLRGTGGFMPPSGGIAGSKINLIQDWIDQGASTAR